MEILFYIIFVKKFLVSVKNMKTTTMSKKLWIKNIQQIAKQTK